MNEPVPAPVTEPLRLVRIRLALALLATAVLPFALGMLVVPTLAGADHAAEQERVGAASASLSASIAAEFERARSGLLFVAANPEVRRALSEKPAADEGELAAGQAAISAIVGDSVAHVAVLDAVGRERLHVEQGVPGTAGRDAGAEALAAVVPDILGLAAGQVYRSEPYDSVAGDRRVMIGARVAAARGTTTGAVIFEVSLAGLLGASGAAASGETGYALIVDSATGAVVADSRAATGDPRDVVTSGGLTHIDEAITDAVDRAGRAVATLFSDGWSVGLTPLAGAVPTLGGWSVVVARPAPALPVHLLVPLGLLIAVIFTLVAWMARQVLRPAIELERSRAELARLYQRASADSRTDVVTGLGNHRAWQEEFERQLDGARRHGVPVALLLIDLDDFRRVNDFTGHLAADGLLRDIAEIITLDIRRGDRAFRVGGDEFAVVMPHSDAAGALTVAQRLLDGAQRPRLDGRLEHPISFSAGIATTVDVAAESTELFAAASAALVSAKRHGRAAVEVYDPARHVMQRASAAEAVAERVSEVIARRTIRPVFQPIVDLSSGRVVAYEGLVRPTLHSGFANPGSLFAAAAACDRVVELDMVCFAVVAAAAAAIPADRAVTFNLSPRTLEATDFQPTRLHAILEAQGIDAARVVLELTEREALEDIESLRISLDACRAAGFRVAADDVGAGNAGLRLLSQLGFDIVKVDLSLVQVGAMREASLEVLRSVVELAGRWGAVVIAEGIETPEQLRIVRGLGVSAGQGYLLGRPGESVSLRDVDLDQLVSMALPAARPPARATAASVGSASGT